MGELDGQLLDLSGLTAKESHPTAPAHLACDGSGGPDGTAHCAVSEVSAHRGRCVTN